MGAITLLIFLCINYAFSQPQSHLTHTVKRGETLYSIAQETMNDGSRWREIVTLNRHLIRNPNDIKVGMNLLIPTNGNRSNQVKVQDTNIYLKNTSPTNTTRNYRVKPGDTLYGIAQKELGHGGSWRSLLEMNPRTLSRPEDLAVGMILKLPGNPSANRETSRTIEVSRKQKLVKKKKVQTKVRSHFTHIVKKGETLYRIAQNNLGDGNQWKQILHLNKDVIRTPSKLKVGMLLKIPVTPTQQTPVPVQNDEIEIEDNELTDLLEIEQLEIVPIEPTADETTNLVLSKEKQPLTKRESDNFKGEVLETLNFLEQGGSIEKPRREKEKVKESFILSDEGVIDEIESPIRIPESVAAQSNIEFSPKLKTKRRPLTSWEKRVAQAHLEKARDELDNAKSEAWFAERQAERRSKFVINGESEDHKTERENSQSSSQPATRPTSRPFNGSSTSLKSSTRPATNSFNQSRTETKLIKFPGKILPHPLVMRSKTPESKEIGKVILKKMKHLWRSNRNLAHNARRADYIFLGEYWVRGGTVIVRGQVVQRIKQIASYQWKLKVSDINDESDFARLLVNDINKVLLEIAEE